MDAKYLAEIKAREQQAQEQEADHAE